MGGAVRRSGDSSELSLSAFLENSLTSYARMAEDLFEQIAANIHRFYNEKVSYVSQDTTARRAR
jgi:hypothetical protein